MFGRQKMNTRDDIARLTKLPKNKISSAMKVTPQQKEKQAIGARIPPTPKNAHLVDEDGPLAVTDQVTSEYNDYPSEADIISTVLEAFGRKIPTDDNIQQYIKTNQKRRSEKAKDTAAKFVVSSFEGTHNGHAFTNGTDKRDVKKLQNEVKSSDTQSNRKKSKDKSKKQNLAPVRQYSRNVLMRSLCEKKMEELQIGNDDSSGFSSGKNDDSDCRMNSPQYVEKPDDPDVLYRLDMLDRGLVPEKLIDDGYRFPHHGIKKTVTPHRYLMDAITDDSFVFKKKL